MACTVAVEEVIDEHYQEQAQELGDSDTELSDLIEECRQDELAHRDAALKAGAKETPGYELLSGVIKNAARTAIWLSKRI